MHLIYHWQRENHRFDVAHGDFFHLSQNSPAMTRIRVGESLWAFTRNDRGEYVLAAELVASGISQNPPTWHYGRHRVYGQRRASRYFATVGVPPVEPVVRALSVAPKALKLGHGFQGHAAVRVISEVDHALLREFSLQLPLDRLIHENESWIAGLPHYESELEQALLAADSRTVQYLVAVGPAAVGAVRRRQILTEVFDRSRIHTAGLRARYDGQCQLCRWSPRERYGQDVCEAHHIQWLSLGGVDLESNLMLLCPNHHRLAHTSDAIFDFSSHTFNFSGRIEALQLNLHLPRLAA